MKGLRLEQPGTLVGLELPEPESLKPGEALVGVRRIGVCGTDIHAFNGKQPFFSYPRILGHELGVEVLALGEGSGPMEVGDRCAVEPYLNCGTCIACRRGKPNCCASLKVLGVHADGGMRERFIVPAAKLHPSKKLTLDQLALVETLGIGAHAVARSGLEAGETALVVGAGPIGLSVIQFAQAAGARVLVFDMNASRLAFCREQLGVADTIGVPPEGLVDELKRLTEGDLPTAVFDATGNPKSMQGAFQYVASGGRLVFVGLFPGDVSFHDPEFHRREMTLMGSRNSTSADFARIIAQIEAGKVDTTPWITHRASLDRAPEEFPAWVKPETGVLKALIEL